MGIRPSSVEVPTQRVRREVREDIVQCNIRSSREDQCCSPCFAHVGALRHVDVVEVGVRPFLQSSNARGIDIVHVVGYWICYDLSLVVVEGGVAGRSGLADYRVAYSVEGDAIVVGPLDMNRCARARVVIGNVDVNSVRCDPRTISLGRVNDL